MRGIYTCIMRRKSAYNITVKERSMDYNEIQAKPARAGNLLEYTLKYDTLLDMLISRGNDTDDCIMFMDMKNRERPVHASEFIRQSETVARHLLDLGIEKHERVIIMLPTGPEFVPVYFGILMSGAIPVPVSRPASTSGIERYLANLRHIIADSGARIFVTVEQIRENASRLMTLPMGEEGIVLADELLAEDACSRKTVSFPAVESDDPALIQYTSGTTGRPKGVVLTHENLLHNIHGIGLAADFSPDDRGISWLPLYHDMGLIGGLFTSLYWKMMLVLMMPEAFLLRPAWWLQNITRFGITVGVSPNFGYQYCVSRISDEAKENLDLGSWRLALNGAEPVDVNTLDSFIESFSSCGLRSDIFFPVYGMAENSLAATFPSMEQKTVMRRFSRETLEQEGRALPGKGDDMRACIDLVSVGYPLPGQEVMIADTEGGACNEGFVGEILVKSPSITPGYYKNRDATDETIVNGWLHTGDMGFMLDGMLFISGRKKEIIIKRGRNIYPYDLERIASGVRDIRRGCCAAFSVPNREQGTEDIVIVCETGVLEQLALQDLKKAVRTGILSRLGIGPDDILLVPKGSIPKTTSGKIQRVLCRELYLSGGFTDGPGQIKKSS